MDTTYKNYSMKVDIPGFEYPIYIQKGLLLDIGAQIKKIFHNKKIVIVTDSNVDHLYGNIIEKNLIKENFTVKKIVIEPGEKSKSFKVLQEVCEDILEFGLKRGDLIISFGGGVVGDLTGLAASILLRGIPFIQIPTSLLAQIDSSIGGKVAINSNMGKNLIGGFYQPKAVFIDPDLLNTLSEKQFSDGMAEVIKYGAIKDENFFNSLLSYKNKGELFDNIEEIIYTCCCIKKTVVQQDEKDLGERMILNFGHTIGHCIEKYFNYEKYTHGEAVAMGMAAITKNSELIGISEKGTSELIIKILGKYNLPFELPEMNENELLSAVQFDKKNIDNSMHVILLKKIGCGSVKKIRPMEIDKYIRIKE